jgi:hypothetical protein
LPSSFLQDFRFGWRMLLHNPRVTVVAVLTISGHRHRRDCVPPDRWPPVTSFSEIVKANKLLAFETAAVNQAANAGLPKRVLFEQGRSFASTQGKLGIYMLRFRQVFGQ